MSTLSATSPITYILCSFYVSEMVSRVCGMCRKISNRRDIFTAFIYMQECLSIDVIVS